MRNPKNHLHSRLDMIRKGRMNVKCLEELRCKVGNMKERCMICKTE